MTRSKDSSVKPPLITSPNISSSYPTSIDSRRPSNNNQLLGLHSAAATGNIGMIYICLLPNFNSLLV
jgi:hypothetical protein